MATSADPPGAGPSPRPRHLSLRALIGTAIGVAATVGIFAMHDFGAVAKAAALAGGGFGVVVAWRFASLLAAAAAWRLLLRPIERPFLPRLAVARWIGEAVNSLLPVAQVGGDVVRTRLARHIPLPGGGTVMGVSAAASVIVDMTVALGAQALFALPGLWRVAQLPDVGLTQLIAAFAVACLPLLLLAAAQRGRMLRGGAALVGRMGLTRLLGPPHVIGESLRRRISAIYRRGPAVAAALFWHLAAWSCRAGEVWLILTLLGHPIPVIDAIMIEGLINAARTAAFLLPAGLGVQEGALLLLCGWIGVGPDLALAMALLKRGRELAVGGLGLAAWLMAERGALRRALKG
jgi:putative membrane protein